MKPKKIPKKSWGGRFSREVWRFIKSQENQSVMIEEIIKESLSFKTWKKEERRITI
jgi:hypothetical protein